MINRLKHTVLITSLALLLACANVQEKPIFADKQGALRGYDPVAYFTLNEAVVGERSIYFDYANTRFYFASDQHRQLFLAEPVRYLPQYGGYCAYGMSRNFVVSIDPNAFTVADGKLYLNYSLGVRNTWLDNAPEYIAKADLNWATKLASGNPIAE